VKPPAKPSDAHWLQSVFENSSLGIARLDRAARIVDANVAFERFFGRKHADLSGRADPSNDELRDDACGRRTALLGVKMPDAIGPNDFRT